MYSKCFFNKYEHFFLTYKNQALILDCINYESCKFYDKKL